jgi:hypothetical protein
MEGGVARIFRQVRINNILQDPFALDLLPLQR